MGILRKALLLPSSREINWESVYQEQLPRVYNFFRYRVDDASAQDLCSTTFEKAWRAREQYRDDVAAFSTWLFTIARNTATDFFRQQRNDVPLDEARFLAAEETPESQVDQKDEFIHLSRLLAKLPERERELLALKFGAGLTNRAIASIVHLSESNVGTILQRTLAKMKTEWDA